MANLYSSDKLSRGFMSLHVGWPDNITQLTCRDLFNLKQLIELSIFIRISQKTAISVTVRVPCRRVLLPKTIPGHIYKFPWHDLDYFGKLLNYQVLLPKPIPGYIYKAVMIRSMKSSALFAAVEHGHVDKARTILESTDVDVNRSCLFLCQSDSLSAAYSSLLHIILAIMVYVSWDETVARCEIECLNRSCLILRQSDSDLVNSVGLTSLDVAVLSGNRSLTKVLIAFGAHEGPSM
ncbi:Ankyrin-repeat and fibronectin type III domain-containing 1 [Homalodisca vitripennis]|nr:Ankyrin-repeat and fibronectin type III domain-containing 1 [Homalodisca vitripennis]